MGCSQSTFADDPCYGNGYMGPIDVPADYVPRDFWVLKDGKYHVRTLKDDVRTLTHDITTPQDEEDKLSAWSVSEDGGLADLLRAEAEERELAATKVQNMFRGVNSRRRLGEKKLGAAERLALAAAAAAADEASQSASAARLQARQRGRLARRALARKEADKRERELAATKLQSSFRGLTSRRLMADAGGGDKLALAAKAAMADGALQDAKAMGEADRAEREAAATRLQSSFRGLTSRRRMGTASGGDKLALAAKAAAADEALAKAKDTQKAAEMIQVRHLPTPPCSRDLPSPSLACVCASSRDLPPPSLTCVCAFPAGVMLQARIRGTLTRSGTGKLYARPGGLPKSTLSPPLIPPVVPRAGATCHTPSLTRLG